jgi:hypothetical protein
MRSVVLRVFALWLVLAGTASAQPAFRADRRGAGISTSLPAAGSAIAEAVPVGDATALKLDGELTEEVWSRAPVIDAFVQRDPKEGAAPTYRTEARVAYDANHLYIAVTAFDPEPDKIVGFLTRRDAQSPSD